MTSFTPEKFLTLRPIAQLLDAIRTGPAYLKKDARIVFVCGANSTISKTSKREIILTYASKHLSSFRFFKAEEVFSALEPAKDSDLLSIEDELGKFSDCIIVICESESAFAELGAFALSKELSKQLLVINDQKFSGEKSFINLGPIKKADRVSIFKPSISSDFSAILLSMTDLEKRLDKIPHKRRRSVIISGKRFDQINRKIRLLLIADLINLLSPISMPEIIAISKAISTSTSIQAETELALGVGLGLFSEFRKTSNTRLFYHSTKEPTHFFDYHSINRIGIRSQIYRIYRQRDPSRLKFLQDAIFKNDESD